MPRSRADVGALILMAGKGTRLHSDLAKVLHPLLGRPMGAWVLAACDQAGIATRVLVIGHQAELVQATFPAERTALQANQNGTGHAVKIGLKALSKDCTTVLVTNGDSPLLTPQTLKALLKAHTKAKAACTLAVTVPEDPSGLGRVFLDERMRVLDMIEDKDCTPEQRRCVTVNSGCYLFDRALLAKYLKKLATANAQGEEYLTDVPTMLVRDGHRVQALEDRESFAVMPNTRADLALAASILQYRIIERLYESGVSLPQPDDVYIEPTVTIAPDTTIWGGTYLRGETRIAEGCTIGPGVDCTDARIGANCTIRYSVVDRSAVGPNSSIGPYAHLRGGTTLGAGCKVGNFVELKNAQCADGVKASHLSYLGDATIGAKTNIGAGTITCNYDGVRKHQTTIGANVFVGSDSILVAPVTLGDDSLIAAGSVITDDVPSGQLAFGRARQENKPPRVLAALKARQRGSQGGHT